MDPGVDRHTMERIYKIYEELLPLQKDIGLLENDKTRFTEIKQDLADQLKRIEARNFEIIGDMVKTWRDYTKDYQGILKRMLALTEIQEQQERSDGSS